MTNEQALVLATHHEQWKHTGITKSFVDILDKQIDRLVDSCCDPSLSVDVIRFRLGEIKQLKQTKQLIYDTKKFIEKSS